MSPRVLLVVLILLVTLLFAGIGLGAARGEPEGQIDPERSPVAWLTGILGGKQPLAVEDLSFASPEACREQFRRQRFDLMPNTSCTLIAGESSRPVRTLTLYVEAGGSAAVVLQPRDDNALRVRQTLSAGDTVRLAFQEKGGALRIACAPGSRCVLGTE